MILISLFIGINYVVRAAELSYFHSKIDYWNAETHKKQSSLPVSNKTSNFPWEKYKNPENKEFFKEGDYTPPEPFMEVAKNPSDDNIKNWLEFIKTKNLVAARLQARMHEYLAKNEFEKETTEKKVFPSSRARSTHSVDPDRFRFRMYFDSHCPHCRRMFSVLSEFQKKGFKIEVSQIDSGSISIEEQIFPLSKASSEEVKKQNIKGVPFLIIADTKNKSLLPPIEGFHEYSEIQSILEKLN